MALLVLIVALLKKQEKLKIEKYSEEASISIFLSSYQIQLLEFFSVLVSASRNLLVTIL